MCDFLSGVMLATGEIAIGEQVDSHEQIIADAGWQNADKSAERPGLCRWEYTGPGGDWTKPLSEWVFRVDEKARPEWFTSEREAECISRAQIVLDRMILRDGTHTIKDGRVFLLGSSHAELLGSSHAVLRGSSHAVLWDSSHAELWDSSHAELWGSSHAVLWGSSHAELCDSSHAELCGSSHAELWDRSHAELWGSSHAVLRGSSHAVLRGSSAKAEAKDSAIVLDRSGNTIIIHGNCKLADHAA